MVRPRDRRPRPAVEHGHSRPGPIVADPFDNWTVQLRKGLIELCILNALEGRERYGYDLVQELVGRPGLGVTEGTIYPLLSRLRVQGLVRTRLEESPEGPARKYYGLTPEGRRTAAMMNEHFERVVRGVRAIRRTGEAMA